MLTHTIVWEKLLMVSHRERKDDAQFQTYPIGFLVEAKLQTHNLIVSLSFKY